MSTNGTSGPEPDFVLPDGRVIFGQRPRIVENQYGFERVEGFMNRREWRQLHAVLSAEYFIFKNDSGDYGERMKCKARNPDGTWRGCGRKHMYISSFCIEMPFRGGDGLEEGLSLAFRVSYDGERKHQLATALAKLPELTSGHPLTARDLAPKTPGENWLAVLISVPEIITKEKAIEFATRINEQHPPQPYCLLEGCAYFMTPDTDCAVGNHVLSANRNLRL